MKNMFCMYGQSVFSQKVLLQNLIFTDIWRYINAGAYLFWSHLKSVNKDTLLLV